MMVSNVDKEEIINYFTGKTEFSEAINQELRFSSFLFKLNNIKNENSSQILKRPNKNKDIGLPGQEKKKKIKKNEEEKKEFDSNTVESQAEKEKEQLRIVEFLSKIEKPIDSKNKAMRKVNKVKKNNKLSKIYF